MESISQPLPGKNLASPFDPDTLGSIDGDIDDEDKSLGALAVAARGATSSISLEHTRLEYAAKLRSSVTAFSHCEEPPTTQQVKLLASRG